LTRRTPAPDSPAADAIFVYGTLRSDAAQGSLLAGLPHRPAWVPGELWHLPAGYPALVPTPEGRVEGELVEGVDPARLAVLDLYEGVSEGLYTRVLLEVRVGRATRLAWAWVMHEPRRRGGLRLRATRWRAPARVDPGERP
jgi:gamma-glutamylcyclotransferase (GGCT)/AIG2-like uncharacterized protein YtfP